MFTNRKIQRKEEELWISNLQLQSTNHGGTTVVIVAEIRALVAALEHISAPDQHKCIIRKYDNYERKLLKKKL